MDLRPHRLQQHECALHPGRCEWEAPGMQVLSFLGGRAQHHCCMLVIRCSLAQIIPALRPAVQDCRRGRLSCTFATCSRPVALQPPGWHVHLAGTEKQSVPAVGTTAMANRRMEHWLLSRARVTGALNCSGNNEAMSEERAGSMHPQCLCDMSATRFRQEACWRTFCRYRLPACAARFSYEGWLTVTVTPGAARASTEHGR